MHSLLRSAPLLLAGFLLIGGTSQAAAWQTLRGDPSTQPLPQSFVGVPYGPYTIYIPLLPGGEPYGLTAAPPAPPAPAVPRRMIRASQPGASGYFVTPPFSSSQTDAAEGGGYYVVPRAR